MANIPHPYFLTFRPKNHKANINLQLPYSDIIDIGKISFTQNNSNLTFDANNDIPAPIFVNILMSQWFKFT